MKLRYLTLRPNEYDSVRKLQYWDENQLYWADVPELVCSNEEYKKAMSDPDWNKDEFNS